MVPPLACFEVGLLESLELRSSPGGLLGSSALPGPSLLRPRALADVFHSEWNLGGGAALHHTATSPAGAATLFACRWTCKCGTKRRAAVASTGPDFCLAIDFVVAAGEAAGSSGPTGQCLIYV